MMQPGVQPHSDYGQREKQKLRRKARQAVPEVSTTAPATRDGRKPFVVEVPKDIAQEQYARETRAAALMVYLCSKDLGEEAPPTRLLLEVSPAQAGDLVRRGLAEGVNLRRIDTAAVGLGAEVVRVLVGRSAESVARTAAHETRHVFQPEPLRSDYDTAENDADTYAEDAMRRLWPAVKEHLPGRAVPEPIPSTTYQTR